MSIKIHNGLSIDFPGSFSELRTELIRIANENLRPAADIEFTRMFAKAVFSEFYKTQKHELIGG